MEKRDAAAALLSIVGSEARLEGKFDIADSIQIECEVGGELTVGGRLVIGKQGSVHANVRTVDAVIMGEYQGKMIATGEVEITETGRVTGNIQTDSLVISKGGSFNGNVTELKEAPALQVVSAEKRRASTPSTFGRYTPTPVDVVDPAADDAATSDGEEAPSETREASRAFPDMPQRQNQYGRRGPTAD